MALRMYISDVIGDGVSITTAFRTRFQELVEANRTTDNETGVLRYWASFDAFQMGFGIGIADLDEATHQLFIADDAIRHLPRSFLNTARVDLTAEQLNLLTEFLQRYGYAARANAIFTDQAEVKDLVWWMMGRRNWDGWNVWDSEAVD